MEYDENDYLMVSGIQHFVFCRRQWALTHIENQWQDNYLTVAGNFLHKKVDNPYISETRGNKFIIRVMPIHSRQLGLTGICDAVEFQENENGVPIHGRKGKYLPVPVEYKHGKEKSDHSDKLQLLAEGVCLEEMMFCHLDYGFLYYGKTKHRTKVMFDSKLRTELLKTVKEMHNYWAKKYTPRVKPSAKCNSCSLRDICLPELLKKETVKEYIDRRLRQ